MSATVTMRDIARMAGCSRTAVSLALSGHPRIPPETRERIVKIAQDAGYQRDALVSALMNRLRTSRQSRSVEKLAYLTVGPTKDEWWKKGKMGAVGYECACERARQLGYELEVFWAKAPGLTAKRLSKILHTRAIRGVLLPGTFRPSSHATLEWMHFSAVVIGTGISKPDLHRVFHSPFQGMGLTLHTLKNRGYKRIGFASTEEFSLRWNEGWLGNYLIHHYRLPASRQIPPLITPSWDPAEFAKWMGQYKPDAVVSNMPEPLDVLRELDFRVPKDVGYASLDRMHDSDPFAGIDQLRLEMAKAAVDLVVSLIETNQYGLPSHPKILHFEGVWCDGPTIRPPATAALSQLS